MYKINDEVYWLYGNGCKYRVIGTKDIPCLNENNDMIYPSGGSEYVLIEVKNDKNEGVFYHAFLVDLVKI